MQRILSGLIALLVLFTSTITYAEREDVPAASGQDAHAILGVRRDVDGAETSTDGDWSYFTLDSNGRLKANSSIASGSNTLSIFPVSNATSLNGIGSGVVGWQRMGADTAETTSTATVIKATAHIGRVGDAVMFTGGTAANQQVWSTISAVTTDTFTLLNPLPATPANGDAFNFLRPIAIGAGPAGSNYQASLNSNIDYNTQLSTATGILKAEDNAASSGDAAVAALVQRADTEGDTTNTDGDYATLHETDGRLSVTQRDRISSGTLDMTSAASVLTINCEGLSTVTITGTRTSETGTLIAQVSPDATNYNQTQIFRPNANFTSGNNLLASNGQLNVATSDLTSAPFFSCHGMRLARVKVQTTGGGTALPIVLRASNVNAASMITGVFPGDGATALGKSEDAAHASGDVGVFGLGVRNTALASLTSTDGDYSPIAVNTNGGILADIQWGMQQNTGLGLLKKEDAASADAEAGVMSLFIREDALTANTNASGDYTPAKTDSSGRLITTMAPMGETFQSCGTATAVTSDVAIKAAVASNRMYVTSITCKNTSATVGTTLDFKDGSTIIATGGITSVQATAPGSFTATFPVPLRGSVNTALNFATNVAVSSATCCAHGYVSTQ